MLQCGARRSGCPRIRQLSRSIPCTPRSSAALAAQPDAKTARPAEPKLDPFVAEATKPDEKDTPLRKLQKERARERALYVEQTKEVIRIGQWDVSFFQEFIKTRTLLAENLAELVDKPADKVKCYEMRVEAMKEFEKFVAALVNTGRSRPQELNLARAARLDAEIDLLKQKGPGEKPAGAKPPR